MAEEIILSLYSSFSKDTWQNWHNEKRLLVFPTQIAEEKFIEKSGHTLFGLRTITQGELWKVVAAKLKEKMILPGQVPFSERESLILELLEEKEFQAISHLKDFDAGIASLIDHLNEIELEADFDYERFAETPVEVALQKLREAMLSRNSLFPAAYNSYLARHAYHVELETPLLFLPPLHYNRQLGGLLKGLARNNQVELALLLPQRELKDAFFSLDIKNRYILKDYTKPVFPSLELNRSQDLVRDSVQAAKHAYQKGIAYEDIVIACKNPEKLSEEFSLQASKLDVPVLVRDLVTTRESLIASQILSLSENTIQEVKNSDLVDDKEKEELIKAKKDKNKELLYLFSLAKKWATKEPGAVLNEEEERTFLWLDGLYIVVQSVLKKELQIQNVTQVIENNLGYLSQRGQGVSVLSYAESASVQSSYLILLTEENSEYIRSPFVSEKLQENLPQLKQKADLEKWSAYLSAENVQVLASEEPGMFFYSLSLGIDSPWFKIKNERELSLEKAAQGILVLPHVEKRYKQLKKEVNEKQRLQGNYTFSVTELEEYNACALDWFIKRVLKPTRKETPQQRKGILSHALLENCVKNPQLLQKIEEGEVSFLGDDLKYWQELEDREKKLLVKNITKALKHFPVTEESLSEVWLEGVYHLNGDETTFRGKADRIDIKEIDNKKHLLVIDYKSNSIPKETEALQPFLYTVLAKEKFQADYAGFLFYSLAKEKWETYFEDGLLFDSKQGNYHSFAKYSMQASSQIESLVTRIKEGDWFTIGNKDKPNQPCKDWCSHKLISGESL